MKRLARLGLVTFLVLSAFAALAFVAADVFTTGSVSNSQAVAASVTKPVALVATRIVATQAVATPTVIVPPKPTPTPKVSITSIASSLHPFGPKNQTGLETLPLHPFGPKVNLDPYQEPPLPANFIDRFKFLPHDQVKQLKPGVIEVNRIIGGENPLRIHVLLFDLRAKELSLSVAVQGDWFQGVAPTSKIAASHHALAAVNGDLFGGTGLPEGLTIMNSRVAIAPKHRATFAWSKDNQPFIGYFTSHWTWDSQIIASSGVTHSLQLLNQPCKADELCIYNDFYPPMPYRQGDVKVLLDPNNVVVGITDTAKLIIPDTYQVLWGLGSTADWLRQNMKVGQPVKIDIHTDVPLDNYTAAVSGGPIILKNGQFNQDCLCNLGDCSGVPKKQQGPLCEEFTLDWKLTHYLDVQMPRVGVGFDAAKNNLIVVEVDGYQPGFSVGIKQVDFAKLFKEFGADTAMELDGGGSATMWANGSLLSHPSDGGGYVERWVPNALLFNWNEQKPPNVSISNH